MCNLPISEPKAIELHQAVKNGIKQYNKKLKANNLKQLVRQIQDSLQRIKTCHGNWRRQRELRLQNK